MSEKRKALLVLAALQYALDHPEDFNWSFASDPENYDGNTIVVNGEETNSFSYIELEKLIAETLDIMPELQS